MGVGDFHGSDVVIVGAGLAGLSAARLLEANGLDCQLLESGSEVGGRAQTEWIDGCAVNVGAEFVGRSHTHIRHLVDQYDLRLESPRLMRRPVVWQNARGHRVGYLPPLSAAGSLALLRVGSKLTTLAAGVPSDAPWNARDARRLDDRTVAEWLEDFDLPEPARQLVDTVISGFMTRPLAEVSLLQLLWWISCSGGVLSAIRDSSHRIFVGGTQVLPEAIAADLSGTLQLEWTVRSVRQFDDCVVCVGPGGEEHRGRRAIVTVPLGAVDSLEFEPELPDGARRLARDVRAGRALKIVAILPRDHAVKAGAVIRSDFDGVAWRIGRRMTAVIRVTDEHDDQYYVDRLASAFDVSASRIVACEIRRWYSDPGFRGTYPAFSPGELTAMGPELQKPHGRVSFAGSARSKTFAFMEGAVESGFHTAVSICQGWGIDARCPVCG